MKIAMLSIFSLFLLSLPGKMFAQKSVKDVKIFGKDKVSWHFYPGYYSFLRVELDTPGASVQNYVLYIDNIPLKNVTPILPIQGNFLNYRFDFSKPSQLDAWKAFFHAENGKGDLGRLGVSVGPEGGVPLLSQVTMNVISVAPGRDLVLIIPAVILVSGFIILLLFTEIFRDPNVSPTNPKKPFSLSRIQFGIWNILILYSLIYIYAETDTLLPMPAQLLGLLGISGTQFALGWGLTKTNDSNYQQSTTSGNLLKDIVASDVNEGLHRYQSILWSVAIWIYFVYSLIVTVDYPDINGQLLLLSGFTSAIYVYGKSKETLKHF